VAADGRREHELGRFGVVTVRLDRPALTWLRVMLGLAFGQIAARRFARSA